MSVFDIEMADFDRVVQKRQAACRKPTAHAKPWRMFAFRASASKKQQF